MGSVVVRVLRPAPAAGAPPWGCAAPSHPATCCGHNPPGDLCCPGRSSTAQPLHPTRKNPRWEPEEEEVTLGKTSLRAACENPAATPPCPQQGRFPASIPQHLFLFSPIQ